ncbi:hypothetical protein DH2020_049494 [Rehmannia glutinosa]|uniref:C2 domain-containing protein n=1 Tax=Rehmannia glutinosa TaxID=99300 RepID=A0ABR0U396_REHGL
MVPGSRNPIWREGFNFSVDELPVEIRRSQHALINPAITITLRAGAGGHGVPPLGNADGRVRYKFASFWNRNHALRALQYAAMNYSPMLEAEKKERDHSTLLDFIKEKKQLGLVDFVKEKQSALHAQSSSVKSSESQSEISEETVAKPEKFQPFIKEEVLTRIYNDVFPCTVEQFFKFILDDGSTFTSEYHTARKDSNLIVFEIIQQTEGVPFASYFENKKVYKIKLDAARSYIKSRISNGEIGNTVSAPLVIQETVEAATIGPSWIPCCQGNNVDCCPENVKKGYLHHFPGVRPISRVHKLIPTIWHRP